MMIHHISPYTPLSPTAAPIFDIYLPVKSSMFNYLISNGITIIFGIINHQPIIFSERVNDPMFVNPKSKIRFFVSRRRAGEGG